MNERVCAPGREVERGDLTKDGNLGKGMPAFWMLENRGGKRLAEVWLLSVSVSIHQRNGLGKPLNSQRALARGFG